MPAIIKLDRSLITNRLRWKPEDDPSAEPRWAVDSCGLVLGFNTASIPDDKLELTVNARVSIPLDCSVAPYGGPRPYHALLAVTPDLFELAEVSAPWLIIGGSNRVRPVIQLRALRKFDLTEFSEGIATIHLID
jgi:hypothetical protein